jgi:fatty acid synthase, animal type
MKTACEEMIDTAGKLGPVVAIFNLAAVLNDKILENQTIETFEKTLRPKAESTRHLDEISRRKCGNLRQFVVFSSLASGRGNVGQCNYAMANSIAENIVEMRCRDGFPGKAIQWGPIADVGMLEKRHEMNKNLEIGGTVPQETASCLSVLDGLLLSNKPVVSSLVMAKKDTTAKETTNIMSDLLSILTIGSDKSLAVEKSLKTIGVDSLTIVEIQQLLEKDYSTTLSSNILRSMSIKEIIEKIEMKAPLSNQLDIFEDPEFIFDFGDENMSEEVLIKANNVEDESLPVAIIVPGVFGGSDIAYYDLARNIKFPTYIMQYHKYYKSTDFDELIEELKNHAVACIKGSKFILIGQSFGASVCLRIAAVLESLGKSGHFISIDGSPRNSYRNTNKQLFENNSENAHETMSLKIMIRNMFSAEVCKEMGAIVFAKNTFEQRANCLYELAKSKYPFSYNYLRCHLLEGLINRATMMQEFKTVNFPVLQRTKFTLLRSSESSKTINQEEDYGLSSFTSVRPFTNIVLDGSHVTIVANRETPQIINSVDYN